MASGIFKAQFHYLFFVFLASSFVGLQISVQGRLLLKSKPDPDNAPATARWNVVSFSDGAPNNGRGTPYFYLTTLDPTAKYAISDERASFTLSEYPIGTCGKIDPENPTCAKITLIGKLKQVEPNSKELEFAKTSLFSKHAEMKNWPKNHDFRFYKLVIENIFLIDWFGGPKPLTVDQYLHFKPNQLLSIV